MKISNSKKQLAKIIHENEGWRDGAEFSAQDKDGEVFGYCQKPIMGPSREVWGGDGCTGPWAASVDTVRNWHQTILSRDEYFHLYPAPVEVVVENKTACHLTVADKPTIEQLAADYRNAKDYADRKQGEADAAKADADEALRKLELAGEANGLVVTPITAKKEPVLVITDWRDLQVGDEVEVIESLSGNRVGEIGVVSRFDKLDKGREVRVIFGGREGDYEWPTKWRFIRRPAKGDVNA